MVLMGWCSLMSVCEVGWGQDNDPKHTVKPTMWMSLIGPAWARAPIKCLRREVQITVHWPSPSNLSDLERICREEWYTIPASRCAKLLVSYPSRFEAVTGVKGASTVSFFFFHNVAKLSKILFSLYYYEVLSIANSSDFSNKKKWGKKWRGLSTFWMGDCTLFRRLIVPKPQLSHWTKSPFVQQPVISKTKAHCITMLFQKYTLSLEFFL